MWSAGDVYSFVADDQLVSEPTKGLTKGEDLRQAQVDVHSSV